ncbi:S-layer homology domain-containing protein [Fusibacter paucivorans]|uniref:S-layer homology domain-containing protein n=1 Tax=Fusibacter paucivorans TaxID=76009 RepID=A0ABS5PLD1_9FIRM|nr:S-layer homology domain-containing protein [Fusibacter paucivorans]MBS7525873.1 S-layer homology domain-containing protein [Fusibacter paucivorans]
MKQLKKIMVGLLLLVLITAALPMNFAADYTSIYDDLKSNYPSIITNLKSDGATDSDIKNFLDELSGEIGSSSGLTESNFDSKMYAALKEVLFVDGNIKMAKPAYQPLALAMLSHYGSVLSSGELSGDLLALRNVVMSKILGSSTTPGGTTAPGGGGAAPAGPTDDSQNDIAYSRENDALGTKLKMDIAAIQDMAKNASDNKLSLSFGDIDLANSERIDLSGIAKAYDNVSKVSLVLDQVAIELSKETGTALSNKVLDLTFADKKLKFDWETLTKAPKDLREPVKITLPLDANENGAQATVYRIDETGTIASVGGYFSDGNVSFFADKPGEYYVANNTVAFEDLGLNDYWAAKKVQRLGNLGIIGGTSVTTFDPSAPITRAQFATLATKMMKFDNAMPETSFSDVPSNEWYAPYVNAALDFGLMSGRGDGIFDPDGEITQQEILIVLSKILTSKGVEAGTEESDSSMAYKLSSASAWATDAVKNAISNGALTDIPLSSIQLDRAATRLETANMLYEVQEELYR